MQKFTKLLTLLSIFTVLLIATGCGPSRMVLKANCPDLREIKAPEGKAAMVIGRATNFGGAINIDNYLDKKFIGTTRGRGFFTTIVEPGEHYVIGDAENWDVLKLGFERGKTYYVGQGVRLGVFSARTSYTVMTGDQLYREMDGHCQYYELDPTANVSDLSDEDFARLTSDGKKGTTR